MSGSAITQIILVVISIVLLSTVVKPKFDEIRTLQDEQTKYKEAKEKHEEFNSKLEELLAKANALSMGDVMALDRYVPTTLDPVAVARDIEQMVIESGLLLEDVEADAESEEVTVDTPTEFNVDPVAVDPLMASDPAFGDPFTDSVPISTETRRALRSQVFGVDALGTYEQLKVLLGNIEKNAYPLQVTSLSFERPEDSDLTAYHIELTSFMLATE